MVQFYVLGNGLILFQLLLCVYLRRRSVHTALTTLTSMDANNVTLTTQYHDDICVPFVSVLSLLAACVDALISSTTLAEQLVCFYVFYCFYFVADNKGHSY